MSWALNNHWFVNFQASQGGEIPLRYRLTTHSGSCDDNAAHRFGLEQATPAIALRDVTANATGSKTGQLVEVEGEVNLLHAKTADDGNGIILRLQNIGANAAAVQLRFPLFTAKSASLASPDERETGQLAIDKGAVTVTVAPGAIQTLRIGLQH